METVKGNITVENDNAAENKGVSQIETETKNMTSEDVAPEMSDILPNMPNPEILQSNTDQPPQSSQSSTRPTVQMPQQEDIPLGDPKALERLDAEEEKWGPEVLWDRFWKHYPKMQAFDSPGTAEILTIRPQDIGLLPRENWGYGNNSFLLHGYYNYRYLIFARVGDEKHTRARYILGVPGHYYSNEKYMASMFGFPHFVLAKTQPAQDGRFGYWYADVRMENVE